MSVVRSVSGINTNGNFSRNTGLNTVNTLGGNSSNLGGKANFSSSATKPSPLSVPPVKTSSSPPKPPSTLGNPQVQNNSQIGNTANSAAATTSNPTGMIVYNPSTETGIRSTLSKNASTSPQKPPVGSPQKPVGNTSTTKPIQNGIVGSNIGNNGLVSNGLASKTGVQNLPPSNSVQNTSIAGPGNGFSNNANRPNNNNSKPTNPSVQNAGIAQNPPANSSNGTPKAVKTETAEPVQVDISKAMEKQMALLQEQIENMKKQQEKDQLARDEEVKNAVKQALEEKQRDDEERKAIEEVANLLDEKKEPIKTDTEKAFEDHDQELLEMCEDIGEPVVPVKKSHGTHKPTTSLD
eukprot:TRINITY_DN4986_c0_g1_i2.p1 TRINITY_DN4986_c0_g1~~TRINITY_DN4986_c0_g1_i2.p1  ORF type:complete len:351 (+),score=162.35 TRINITY_DN4986_c0_g1_i2:118-1170(+)